MNTRHISYKVKDMNIVKNHILIQHIYLESGLNLTNRQHPLDMICKSISKTYHVDIKTDIYKSDAVIDIELLDMFHDKNDKILKRFESITKSLLIADVEIIKQ